MDKRFNLQVVKMITQRLNPKFHTALPQAPNVMKRLMSVPSYWIRSWWRPKAVKAAQKVTRASK